ncbi:MAG TPA: polysaccharide deacetylase family protein [Chitinophagaceae bacterium]|jgi:peptidoglycan/xylan/chitin deacetylase (PgdA/CDA1 family)|nr:polysaccharide deacetylase family protein [Chitinophagaceae bacterium]
MKFLLSIRAQNIGLTISAVLIVLLYSSCESNSQIIPVHTAINRSIHAKQPLPRTASAAEILHRPQVPILCYHRIRDFLPSDSRTMKDYIVPINKFREQMKLLADNGYHTISPNQLYDYLVKGSPLPPRPVIISFDDTREEQYTIAHEELKKYDFQGVYFIMTVSLGRPGYMTKQEVKQLADEGNTIGSHTWNHSNVKNYAAQDWVTQIDKPSQELEKITGKPIEYFAYPFGLWNKPAIEQLKQRGFKAAFQLSAKRDENDPLFTIRRIIVPGEWSTNTLEKWMKNNF